MTKQITRTEAIELIIQKQLPKLSIDEKKDILLAEYWWHNDEIAIREAIAEKRFPELSEELIQLILSHKEAPAPNDPQLDILYLDYLKFELLKVTNQYLSYKLNELVQVNYQVIGEPAVTSLCPCCEYYSLDEDDFYDICSICFWENGGAGPNHMFLEEAQANFKKYGAMSESALKFVDPEGKLKFRKK